MCGSNNALFGKIAEMPLKQKNKELYGTKPPGIKFGGLGSSPSAVGSLGGKASGAARRQQKENLLRRI